MTQQQIADIIHTSKANVCLIEKMAMRKIRRAQETLAAIRVLDAHLLCTLESGSDLFDSIPIIINEAGKAGIVIPDNPLDLINRIRADNSDRIHGRFIKNEIRIFFLTTGELFFR